MAVPESSGELSHGKAAFAVPLPLALVLCFFLAGPASAQVGSKLQTYRNCIKQPALEYQRMWENKCSELSNDPNCELPSRAAVQIENIYRQRRLQCLRRMDNRNESIEEWETVERANLANPDVALPTPNTQGIDFLDWLAATLIISSCIVGILHHLRRKPDQQE